MATNLQKNIVQDVMPPKRQIQKIDIPERRKNKISEKKITPSEITPKTSITQNKKLKETKTVENVGPSFAYPEEMEKKSHIGLWIALVVFVLAASFGVSALFKKATIKITPKMENVSLSERFVAEKNAAGSVLSFQTVTVTKDSSQSVPALGQKPVSSKAVGKIVIYNKSSSTQKLIANTRLETPEGLIFRLASSVVVPAAKADIFGNIEAPIVADLPGDKYNVGLKDFTFPGLKGSTKYTQVFARSKTAVAGGFSGIQKIVSDDVLKSTDKNLETNLHEGLLHDLSSQIPANYILYPQSINFSSEETSQINSSTTVATSSAILHKKGTATAIIFDRGSLSRSIISKVLPEAAKDGDNIKITNLDSLSFYFATSTTGQTFSLTDSTLNFKIDGSVNLLWLFDVDKLKSDLLGLSKDKAKMLITTYKSIDEATITTEPFWNNSIPGDPKKVEIINIIDSN